MFDLLCDYVPFDLVIFGLCEPLCLPGLGQLPLDPLVLPLQVHVLQAEVVQLGT